MDNHVKEVDRVPKFSCKPKVHYSICYELIKLSEKIISILPAIESARPGSSSGIQTLCSLNNVVEKTKLLVRYCSESSKLYLAITTESIASRCERVRTQLNQCLCEIQTMVPSILASKIAEVLVYLGHVKFIINPEEEQAGTVLSNLLAQIEPSEDQEFEAFQIAASKLNITSSTALLVERREISKLLDSFLGVDYKKEIMLKYFLYLIKKHGKQLMPHSGEYRGNTSTQSKCLDERKSYELDPCTIRENAQPPFSGIEIQSELFNGDMPPIEFCCPISSSLMYDPVVIASGQTYERICIEKWFSEGHDTCPKTQKKLENFSWVPNSSMRDLVSSWCKKHSVILVDPCIQPEEPDVDSWESIHCNSVSSLKNISAALLYGPKGNCLIEREICISSLCSGSSCCSDSSPAEDIETSNNNQTQLFTWSNDYQKYKSFSNFSQDMYLKFLFELSELPTLLQLKAVEDIKNLLEDDKVTHYCIASSGFAEALIKFFKKAYSLSDIEAQRSGAQIFLALVTSERWELTFDSEDAIKMLLSFLHSGMENEAMMILQKLILHSNYLSCIIASNIPLEVIRFLNSNDTKSIEVAVFILSELSYHGELKCHFMSSGFIEKIGQLLSKRSLVRFCLNILQNIADDEEVSNLIADSNGCIASIAEILEFGSPEEQEQAVTILLLICSRSLRNCLLVLKEGVIPSIVDISVSGNAMGKENSLKLLHILRNIRRDCLDSPQPHSQVDSERLDSPQRPELEFELIQYPANNSKKIISDHRYPGFFSRKMRRISKFLALF